MNEDEKRKLGKDLERRLGVGGTERFPYEIITSAASASLMLSKIQEEREYTAALEKKHEQEYPFDFLYGSRLLLVLLLGYAFGKVIRYTNYMASFNSKKEAFMDLINLRISSAGVHQGRSDSAKTQINIEEIIDYERGINDDLKKELHNFGTNLKTKALSGALGFYVMSLLYDNAYYNMVDMLNNPHPAQPENLFKLTTLWNIPKLAISYYVFSQLAQSVNYALRSSKGLSASFDLLEAQKFFNADDSHSAFKKIDSCLYLLGTKGRRKKSIIWHLFENFRRTRTYANSLKLLRNNPNNMFPYVSLITSYILDSHPKYAAVRDEWKSRFDNERSPAETRIAVKALDALVLGAINRMPEARQQWSAALVMMLAQRDTRFVQLGETRNQVLRYETGSDDKSLRFVRDITLVKRYRTETSLETETRNIEYFSRYFYGSVTRLATTTGLDALLISGGTKNLWQQPSKNGIRRAVKFLAYIHKIGTEGKEELKLEDPADTNSFYFEERLANTLFRHVAVSEEMKSTINEDYHVVWEPILAYHRKHKVLYKDANPRNWVLGNNGRLIAIDFESNLLMPPQLDLVSILEFGEHLSEEELREHIDVYLDYAGLNDEDARAEFHKVYDFVAVQRHLEWIGYLERDIKNRQEVGMSAAEQQHHKERALFYLSKLRNVSNEEEWLNLYTAVSSIKLS